MSAWFYAVEGQQRGPVPREELVRLIATGTVKAGDLVWTEGMPGWTAASEIPGLVPAAPVAPPPEAASLNPYQAPEVSTWESSAAPNPFHGEEIVPGSQPLEIGECVRRGYELVKRHFWPFFGALAASFVFGFFFSVVCEVLTQAIRSATESQDVGNICAILSNIAGHILETYFGLGLTRIGLNIVSGQPFSLAMLFGQGDKLLRTVLASILYGLMVAAGLLLLIVPGIYLALRFGQYQNAIVDKNLGVFESLAYSARLTEGNKTNLFGLIVICILLVLAGLLALLIGACFTIPLTYLILLVAYRWLQHGRAVLRDDYRA